VVLQACKVPVVPGYSFPSPLLREVPIRTLGVSLVAIAAIVASLALARQRSEERQPELPAPTPRTPAAVDLNLDAIRSAGF
jgi:hypothetical protein